MAIEFALTTGMCRGEVCALRWSDLGDDGAITVWRALGSADSGYYVKEPKTRRSRAIPLIGRTFATMMIAGGCDARTVASYLGYASVSMTLDTYADVDPEAKRAAVSKVAEAFDVDMSLRSRMLATTRVVCRMFNQARDAGWHVARGARSTATVEFWSWYVRVPGSGVVTLQRVEQLVRAGRLPEEATKDASLRGRPHHVFNASQVKRVEPYDPSAHAPANAEGVRAEARAPRPRAREALEGDGPRLLRVLPRVPTSRPRAARAASTACGAWAQARRAMGRATSASPSWSTTTAAASSGSTRATAGGRRRVELLEAAVLVPGRDPHLASPLSLLPLLLISCCICPALSAWRNPPGSVVCLVKPDLRVGTAVVILDLFLHCQLGVVKPNWTIS